MIVDAVAMVSTRSSFIPARKMSTWDVDSGTLLRENWGYRGSMMNGSINDERRHVGSNRQQIMSCDIDPSQNTSH